MLIAKVEIAPGLKNPAFHNRFWQASNLAMWAMSPPQKRCFLVKVKNYDYVPLQIKQITLSTGDKREEITLKHSNDQPIYTIPVAGEHLWAIDAMPLFLDIACALQEDQAKVWQKLHNRKTKKGKRSKLRRYYLKALASIRRKVRKITFWTTLWAEAKLWLIALEDFIEEKLLDSPDSKDTWKDTGLDRIVARLLLPIQWGWHFLIYLPVFALKIIWLALKQSAKVCWNFLREPFLKYKSIKHKRISARIEFQNGWKIKTKPKVEITYFFIEEKIMPLMFAPEELRPQVESRNEFLDTCLKLLQLPKQAV